MLTATDFQLKKISVRPLQGPATDALQMSVANAYPLATPTTMGIQIVLTPTTTTTALQTLSTTAHSLQTQIKLTATAMASATLVKHSQATAMEMVLLILAMCRLALLRTAIPTVNLMNVKMDPFGDRLVIWVVSGPRQAQKLQQALCSTCQRQSRM
jgi:hypothetical protein